MPYAIELYLNEKASTAIEQIHSTLKENGIKIDEGTKPHLSLCIYEDLPLVEFEAGLRRFARTIKPFEVTFPKIDAFKTERPVIFLAPQVSSDLLEAHEKFHDNFKKYSDSVWEYYRPKVWVPHCTLCMDLSQDMYSEATKILTNVQLPIKGSFERIGILKFRPNEQLSIFELG